MISRGTVMPPAVNLALREHRERLRQLEAQRGNLNDGDWTPITVGLNSWLDNAFPNGNSVPCAYIVTANGWLGLRGRVICGQEGHAAFLLPTEVWPRYPKWFAVDVGSSVGGFAQFELSAASHVGHVLVKSNGYVIPYLDPPGFGGYSPTSQIDTFAGGSTLALTPPYIQPGPSVTWKVLVGGGLGKSGSFTPVYDWPLIYVGNERFIDGEVWATLAAGATDLLLGQRCQWYPGLTFSPSPGYWMELTLAAGGDLKFHIVSWNSSKPFTTPDIATYTFNSGTTPQFINPGFGAGDTIRFQLINNTFYVFSGAAGSNDPPIFSADQVGTSNVPVISSGYFGLGALGPDLTSLVSAWGGGMPRNNSAVGAQPLGAALDGVFYKIGG